jgi:transcription-repair coupling factor (superfamily II helicase)
VRISLYARLARLRDLDEASQFAEEIEDRFGSLPDEVVTLLDLARVSMRAREAGVSRLIAGPKGVALTLTDHSTLATANPAEGEIKGGRLILPPLDGEAPAAQVAEELLERLQQPGA